MLFNTGINIDTSTSMIHKISTSTLCLLLFLLLFMISATAKACFSQCTNVYIYGAYIDGSIIQPWHLQYMEMQFLVSRYPQV